MLYREEAPQKPAVENTPVIERKTPLKGGLGESENPFASLRREVADLVENQVIAPAENKRAIVTKDQHKILASCVPVERLPHFSFIQWQEAKEYLASQDSYKWREADVERLLSIKEVTSLYPQCRN